MVPARLSLYYVLPKTEVGPESINLACVIGVLSCNNHFYVGRGASGYILAWTYFQQYNLVCDCC